MSFDIKAGSGADIKALYQEVILDHNRNPRNFHKIDPCSHHAEGHNPLCGDQIEVYLNIEDGVITDIAFQGEGCAISTASSSMMTEAIKGKSIAEAEALFQRFHDAVTLDAPGEGLGALQILTGVREYPARVKCATLPWHALYSAIHAKDEVVQTE
ncbi:Fe-S cluster assembly sulfur transfer protein SufU [Ignatzschineria cameli]|uniref:SUF system NifU family Fe-S cluster assembly protein n=1 Tax=Ignatzschineria cameli TaxID=2182793 RepID=A0A2U2AQD8_9GAMM|nr:SUF system NifU family Fe-S cluster assembly protein [Ignatzschineria cameli]PWD85768.1 SUF system NifU family Fe-S cluster assembly protein [Ignatzschineria cameli]PWD89397.1 SUF system NifU family Fe-S cluster assembly protein [Ignatzschineria cameli]PWD90869.1 SUF system NifU family Fe-S cluster assembly protein [Ignatzschineria cameli]PWD91657.1 SUF system NifU family Fe-S cluster assembly protein [Ignatzschineria cameli]